MTVRIALLSALLVFLPMVQPAGKEAFAQSPTPYWYMQNAIPGAGFPSPANSVVVEGLGMGSCPAYSETSVWYATVAWINSGYQTVTEVSPQPTCASLSSYEWYLTDIKNQVIANAPNWRRYWAGLMLDEEPNWFSTANTKTLNGWVLTNIGPTMSPAWIFTENQPTGWGTAADYHGIIAYTWAAPQVYNQNFANAVNTECSTYGMCTNVVTVATQTTDNCKLYGYFCNGSYAISRVNGTPWSYSPWNGGLWYNVFA